MLQLYPLRVKRGKQPVKQVNSALIKTVLFMLHAQAKQAVPL